MLDTCKRVQLCRGCSKSVVILTCSEITVSAFVCSQRSLKHASFDRQMAWQTFQCTLTMDGEKPMEGSGSWPTQTCGEKSHPIWAYVHMWVSNMCGRMQQYMAVILPIADASDNAWQAHTRVVADLEYFLQKYANFFELVRIVAGALRTIFAF